ncbi:helix-turn-helix domain-containing protein [Sulfurimonas sp. SWIR-19]|uniref:helix-turn-helix domain-containing protein n=1 Tax=Sulfurimonas sp. SWIR-19 TaxID=2878390 RepID=UPI001CF4775D|nr:helix-turn-helix transcriptional regulator [Sulfurimonas sp. SWIR-19]UCN00216.1 helix-turn-helix domain-containing protein [Sulfurimonas sp. SWIR-19]
MKNIAIEVERLHKRIGKNVKKLREGKKLTQLDLALAIGQKSTTIISQAELGTNKHFNIEQLYKISKVLGCDITDFFN